MTTKRWLEDVNLSGIEFLVGRSGVILRFLNMFDGAEVGVLECSKLLAFNYHTLEDGGLPHYVGEVDDARVHGVELRALLQRFDHGYPGYLEDADSASSVGAHHIHIEGDLVLTIVCEDVLFSRSAESKQDR